MKTTTTLVIFVTAIGLFTVSCSDRSTNDGSQEEVTNSIAKDVNEELLKGAKERDSKHIVDLYSGGLYEIAISQEAEVKASSKKVKDLATLLINDHSMLNKQIEELVANEEILLPSDISEDAKAQIVIISGKKGLEYDIQFIDDAIGQHTSGIEIAERLANDGYNDAVKVFFAKALTTLKHHLAMAEEVKIILDKR